MKDFTKFLLELLSMSGVEAQDAFNGYVESRRLAFRAADDLATTLREAGIEVNPPAKPEGTVTVKAPE